MNGQIIAHCMANEIGEAVFNVSIEALKLLEYFHYQLIFTELKPADSKITFNQVLGSHEDYLFELFKAVESKTPNQMVAGYCNFIFAFGLFLCRIKNFIFMFFALL